MKVLHTLPSNECPRHIIRRPAYALLVLLLLFAASSLPLISQQFATVNLTVTDPAGSVIAQANVSVQNVDTGVVRAALSDKLGLTVIPGLPAGQYKLTADAQGFATYEAPLTLTVGQTASLQIALQVRAKTELVEVHATPEGVDKERTEDSQVINPVQINQLPIADRDFIDFVLLTPTATVGRDSSTGAQSAFQETVLEISFGGLRETHSVFYGLDGINYTTTVSGIQRASPSLDWVQEFRVVDGPDAAGGGLNLGAAVNTITKSGTNDVHGSLYD